MILTTFKIPLLPPSINAIYKINYNTKQVYMDEAARKFKREAILYIPPLALKEDCKAKVFVEYNGKFFNNDGSIKRKDGQNLDKCLYDVMFEKWGVDDSCVWEGRWTKVHNPDNEFTLVTVEEIKEADER